MQLGLQKGEFFQLTTRELKALLRWRENERKGEEFLAAQIAAAIMNFSPVHPRDVVQPKDLMPSEVIRLDAAPRKDRSESEIADELRSVMQRAGD